LEKKQGKKKNPRIINFHGKGSSKIEKESVRGREKKKIFLRGGKKKVSS